MAELQRTIAFLAELNYNVVALNHTLVGKLPPATTFPTTYPLPFPIPPKFHILARATYIFPDASSIPFAQLPALAKVYDIVALRPTTEKAMAAACALPDVDLISLDLSARYPFHFRHKMFSTAVQRGIKFEICYGAATRFSGTDSGVSGTGPTGGNKDGGSLDAMIPALDAATARRNLIANATSLIRALRGRSVVISGEARRALACRGPSDVVNLACVWGLKQEKGVEAIGKQARAVVVQAELRRRGWRGVVDVVSGGAEGKSKGRPEGEKQRQQHEKDQNGAGGKGRGKRKADAAGNDAHNDEKPLSKRQMKKKAWAAKIAASKDAQKAKQASGNEEADTVANAEPNKEGDEVDNQGNPSGAVVAKTATVVQVADSSMNVD